jgi:hypothetical protein
MKRSFLSALLLSWVLLAMHACRSNDQRDPLPQLQTIGFTGTLPYGEIFDKEASVARQGLISSSSTVDGSFISHDLAVLDTAAGIKLAIELPYIQYSEHYQQYSEDDQDSISQVAKKHYSYPVVKEKLALGEKWIFSSQHPDQRTAFRLQMVDEKNYVAYTCESLMDQTASYLKVKQITEGVEINPFGGQVKKIEVLFELDVKLYSSNWTTEPAGRMKGLLKVKYLEK